MLIINFKMLTTILYLVLNSSTQIHGDSIFERVSSFVPLPVADLTKKGMTIGYNTAVNMPVIGKVNEKLLSAASNGISFLSGSKTAPQGTDTSSSNVKSSFQNNLIPETDSKSLEDNDVHYSITTDVRNSAQDIEKTAAPQGTDTSSSNVNSSLQNDNLAPETDSKSLGDNDVHNSITADVRNSAQDIVKTPKQRFDSTTSVKDSFQNDEVSLSGISKTATGLLVDLTKKGLDIGYISAINMPIVGKANEKLLSDIYDKVSVLIGASKTTDASAAIVNDIHASITLDANANQITTAQDAEKTIAQETSESTWTTNDNKATMNKKYNDDVQRSFIDDNAKKISDAQETEKTTTQDIKENTMSVKNEVQNNGISFSGSSKKTAQNTVPSVVLEGSSQHDRVISFTSKTVTGSLAELAKNGMINGYKNAVNIPMIGKVNDELLSNVYDKVSILNNESKTTGQGTDTSDKIADEMPIIVTEHVNESMVNKATIRDKLAAKIVTRDPNQISNAENAVKSTVSSARYVAQNVLDSAKTLKDIYQNLIKEILKDKSLNISMTFLIEILKLFMPNTIKLPEFTKTFDDKGIFTASEGIMGPMDSLQIDGDIKVAEDGLTILVDIPIKFDKLYIFYPEISLETEVLTKYGGLGVNIPENLINIHLHINIISRCWINVETIDVKSLRYSYLNMKGDDFEDHLFDPADHLNEVIKKQIQTIINDYLQEEVGNPKILSFICNKIDPRRMFQQSL